MKLLQRRSQHQRTRSAEVSGEYATALVSYSNKSLPLRSVFYVVLRGGLSDNLRVRVRYSDVGEVVPAPTNLVAAVFSLSVA